MGTLFDLERPLAAKLRALSKRGIHIGSSSWKFEGWLGQIYTPERYFTRGKFSQAKFEETCLEEYAETFPIVCGDFSFYQFPAESFWRKLFAGSPHALRFAFKVPEEITVKTWPSHARYGGRAGLLNENFLSTELFKRMFFDLLRPYGERVELFIFEFGTFSRSQFSDAGAFLEMLDSFLSALPEDGQYAVEIRNPEFLCKEYFDVLRSNGVAHVFNSWTRMPDLSTQTAMEAAYTLDFTVARALLRPGRSFEEAVKSFQPFREIQDPCPETRDALRSLIQRSLGSNSSSYIFVSNRWEGNAPASIEAVVEEIELS